MNTRMLLRVACLSAATALVSCQTNRYTASLSLTGVDHQADLSQRVTTTLDAFLDCETGFEGALDFVTRFTAGEVANETAEGAVAMEPGIDLALYNELLDQVDRCATHVQGLEPQMAQLDADAAVLFSDWETELNEFASPVMRARSEARLNDVRGRFDLLRQHMGSTRDRFNAGLVSLRDYVLFFNHNLNLEAITSLSRENEDFGRIVRSLSGEIEAARRFANSFVVAMQGRPMAETQD